MVKMVNFMVDVFYCNFFFLKKKDLFCRIVRIKRDRVCQGLSTGLARGKIDGSDAHYMTISNRCASAMGTIPGETSAPPTYQAEKVAAAVSSVSPSACEEQVSSYV